MPTIGIIILACISIALFAAITHITIGFGFLTRPAKKIARILRDSRNKPKTRKYPLTYGREFLMLRKPHIRLIALGVILYTNAVLATFLFGLFGFLGICALANHQPIWLIVLLMGNAILALLWQIRHLSRRLSPYYRLNRLTKARRRFDEALNDFNAHLPPTHYRVAALPEAAPHSLNQLRVLADEHHLPDKLKSRLSDVEKSHAELEAAEHALAEAQGEKERRTAKAT